MAESLRAPRLLSLDWRVDAIVSTSTLGQVRKLGQAAGDAAAGVGGGVGGSIGEPVISMRLGLSYGAGGTIPRTPASEASATPLLLSAILAKARRGRSQQQLPATAPMGSPGDEIEGAAALAALGITRVVTGSGASSSHHDALLSSSGVGGTVGNSILDSPKVHPSCFLDFSLTSPKAAAFLAELRIANTILEKTLEALPPPQIRL